jgi:hypothetical protein
MCSLMKDDGCLDTWISPKKAFARWLGTVGSSSVDRASSEMIIKRFKLANIRSDHPIEAVDGWVAYIIAYLHLYSLFWCEMRCLVLIFEPDSPKYLRNISPHRPMWTGRLVAISTYKQRIYIGFPSSFDRLCIAYLATLLLEPFPTELL